MAMGSFCSGIHYQTFSWSSKRQPPASELCSQENETEAYIQLYSLLPGHRDLFFNQASAFSNLQGAQQYQEMKYLQVTQAHRVGSQHPSFLSHDSGVHKLKLMHE